MHQAMSERDNQPPKLRGPPPGATEPPEHVKNTQVYEIFNSSTTPDRERLYNVPATGAEGQPARPQRPSLKDGVQSIKSEDFLKVHHMPCAREGLMTGIGTGAVVGAGRYFVGGMFIDGEKLGHIHHKGIVSG